MPIIEQLFREKRGQIKFAPDVHAFARENIEALLLDYSCEIPDKLIHSDQIGATHKVQKTWFTMVVLTMELDYVRDLISIAPNIAREARKFHKYYTSNQYEGRNTKAADIKRANRLLKRTLMVFGEWEMQMPSLEHQPAEPVMIDNLAA